MGRDFDRLTLLLVSDRLKSLIPQSLADFVRQRELEGWIDPQDLARAVDTFVADRNRRCPEGANQVGEAGGGTSWTRG